MRRQRPLVLHADRRAATSGPTAAPAAPNGPACGLPTCSRPRSRSRRRCSPGTTAPTCISPATPSADALSRGVPTREGDGRQQPDRLGDERRAAAEHPRRAGAARHSRLAGLGVAQMAHPHLGARQGARRPGHGATSPTACRSSRWCRATRAIRRTSAILESMPVRSIITSPANGAKLPAGTKEVKLRGAAWAGDNRGAPGRCLDRLRRDLAARQARQAEEQVRLAALDRDREAAVGRLFRDLDARHRFQGRDAAASGRASGIRRATAAIRCTGSRCWSAESRASRACGGRRCAGRRRAGVRIRPRAGAALRAARREPRGLSRRRRPRRHVLCLHRLPRLSSWSRSRA